MEPFAIARLVIGIGFLAVAAILDVRTRRVRDSVWVALGSVGLGVLVLGLVAAGVDLTRALLVGSAAILFYAVFYGKPLLGEDGFHARPLRLVILGAAAAAFLAALLLPQPPRLLLPRMAFAGTQSIPFTALATVPVLMVLYQVFFQVGLLRGGADTKALMALTLLVPYYPDFSPFPLLALPANIAATMETLFPFSLIVVVNAAILFLLVPLAYLVVNAVRGEAELPQALFGTKAPLDRLPPHVWLMERVDRRGERVAVLFPSRTRDESEEIAKLKAAGAERVWVQPKVPFMVPLLLGFLLAFFVGNVMLAFLAAVLPHA